MIILLNQLPINYKIEENKVVYWNFFNAVKEEFLSGHIFDFSFYASEPDEYFCKKMIEVLDVILNKKNFEYIKSSEENYYNYLSMCNSRFLYEKLDWGTSIRGAWFSFDSFEINNGEIEVKEKELEIFIKDLIFFYKTF